MQYLTIYRLFYRDLLYVIVIYERREKESITPELIVIFGHYFCKFAPQTL